MRFSRMSGSEEVLVADEPVSTAASCYTATYARTYKGVAQMATGVTANAVRTWSQAKFELGAHRVILQTAMPCIRGVKTQVNNLSNTSSTHSCYQ